jgi:hypothetical protein
MRPSPILALALALALPLALPPPSRLHVFVRVFQLRHQLVAQRRPLLVGVEARVEPEEITLLYRLSYNPPYSPAQNKRRYGRQTEKGLASNLWGRR